MALLDISAADNSEKYSDGPVEAEILNFVSLERGGLTFNDESPWPLRYHFLPARENLLSWFPFDPNASLLEVGAGCGALTGLFCRSVRAVTAVELTRMRAEIVFYRHSKFANLQVVAGNLSRLSFPTEFDYVTCIGVLEYAERFFGQAKGAPHLMSLLRKQLRPGGQLILAIENRFGLKYWAGAKEDHTNRWFESLEGYPRREGIRTFGRAELCTLVQRAGFGRPFFYYPFPDYKFPEEIFSDDFQPTRAHPIRSGLFPTPDPSKAREYLFDERSTMDGLVENGLFREFANSFLLIAEAV